MIGKDIQETYGVRVYKDGKPIIEYPYYSLKKIYEHTIKYENEEDLTKSISESIKKKHSELYEENSKYTAKIVYYPNKEEAKNLINNNPNYVMTNGETSDLMPLLFWKDKDIFEEDKTKKRYEELVSSDRFRRRISNLFWETEGLSKIAKAYRHSKLQEDSDFYGMKLYDAVSNGFKWYTAIYVIMSREFPKPIKEEKKVSKPVQTEMDYKKEIPWIDWFYLDDEEKDYYKQGPMQEGDSLRLFEYVSRKEGESKKR